MNRRLGALAAVLVLVVGAGCGGTDTDNGDGAGASPAGAGASPAGAGASPAGAPPVALDGRVNDQGSTDLSGAGPSPSLELELDDFHFEPTYVKAAPGASVSVELFNEGQAGHTFTIDGLDIDEELGSQNRKQVTVTAPESGSVSFYCRFHRDVGMQGAFHV